MRPVPVAKFVLRGAALAACVGLLACAAVDSVKVNGPDLAAPGGQPVAVISTWEGGFTLFWGLVVLSGGGRQMDDLLTRNLITEAKANGADKVHLLSLVRLPPDHLFARVQPLLLVPGLLNFHFAYASAMAVASESEAPIGVIEGPIPPEMLAPLETPDAGPAAPGGTP